MSGKVLRSLFVVMLVAGLLAGCVVPPVPAQPAPVVEPTAVAVEPTAVPAEPTAAPVEPTAEPTVEPTAAPAEAAGTLILATTTSTADSGLLDFILPEFEAMTNSKVDVIAVGTGQALEIGSKGDADVVLVHSRKGEDQFVADGNAVERFDVMYNDFVIVGPKADPAKITGMEMAADAFKAIMDSESLFVSRGDKSGTNTKELGIWSSIQVTPTAEMQWYNSIGQGMGDTLLFANEQDGYTLTDRGTYLAMSEKLPNLTILVGGGSLDQNKDKTLLNPYGVLPVNPEKFPNVNAALATQFVDWLLSLETQKTIGGFGVDKFGQPLFYPSSDEWKASREVTVKIGDAEKTYTLDDLKAMPAVTIKGYEATGHKKGPLGVNDWTGASVKKLLLATDPTIADEANAGKFILVTATDGWHSVIRWDELFGESKGGQALADSYGCTECHGYAGQGVEGKKPAPALAGKGWTAEALGVLMRAGHAGIKPYTVEQMSDADLAEIALWLKDPTAAPPADAYAVPEGTEPGILAYERNGQPMNGRDGLIQLIMPADKYSSRYAHWVASLELVDSVD